MLPLELARFGEDHLGKRHAEPTSEVPRNMGPPLRRYDWGTGQPSLAPEPASIPGRRPPARLGRVRHRGSVTHHERRHFRAGIPSALFCRH